MTDAPEMSPEDTAPETAPADAGAGVQSEPQEKAPEVAPEKDPAPEAPQDAPEAAAAPSDRLISVPHQSPPLIQGNDHEQEEARSQPDRPRPDVQGYPGRR